MTITPQPATPMMPVADFIEHVFLPQCSTRLRASTTYGYTRLFHEHKEFLPAVSVEAFRTVHGEEMLQRIHTAKGLGRNSLHNIQSFFSGVFKYAQRTGVVDRNPMQNTSLPRATPQAETMAYSLEEVSEMLRLVPGRGAVIVAVAAYTGLRRGELAGLQWSDYTGGMLYVRRAMWMGTSDLPKTRKSAAPVPVIKPLADRLDAWRGELFMKLGHLPLWLFGEESLDMQAVEDREIVPYLPDGVWYGWHCFRRGLATSLKKLGVDDMLIQAILRHANVSTTRQSYIKTDRDDVRAAMEKLSSKIQQGSAP